MADEHKEKSETAAREEEVLAFWKEDATFEKSLTKEAPKGDFLFYDGPPFATGLPHTGSLLASIIKDVIPRYKTMRGYRVPRVWGWDCHGLPIENLIEKKLELKNKKDIERIGVATFNEAARSSVLEYAQEWEGYVERVGRWVDFKNSYKTMDNSYIEAVWWALKNMHEKGLLYEGRKVLMYCPHCETPLAKAEIAQDNTYKDITEEAVTVKFKVRNPEKLGLKGDVFLLAWTTTPWTLPGNVALAVGEDINYTVSTEKGAQVIIAAARQKEVLRADVNPAVVVVDAEFKGSQLVGLEYEPLFKVPALTSANAYKVYAADFVTTTEGTGTVHTAVMYGEDDFKLGEKEKLPMVQLLNPNGTYNNEVPEFLRGQYIKKAEKDIKEDLEKHGLLFDKQNHTHSYPHCYRCGTPLIYNAVASWFLNIQKVKNTMLSENEKVNWVPEHLKHGRFKHIVENAPDWTISRNRFWASPLPIWKDKGGPNIMVIGSVEELKQKVKKSGNRYFTMRHGESENNVKRIGSSKTDDGYHLTDTGITQVKESLAGLKEHIDEIYFSPVTRTADTATLAADALGVPDQNVHADPRLLEISLGAYEGRPYEEYDAAFPNSLDHFESAPDGGENWNQVRRRVGDFLYELERTRSNKNILIISHGDPLWFLMAASRGASRDEILHMHDSEYVKTGEIRELPFVPLPVNLHYELDLHRPYTDYLTLVDEQGREYERTPEVVDCWVESGSMPFAQFHKLGENIEKPPVADFIAEYIAQTRTWFYYMHATGALLFNRQAFKNVVSTGTILAADGSKISKSKGNYTDPMNLMERYGADALRFALMQSVVMQAEDLNFRDEDVREAHNRVLGILWNSYKFFELYKGEYDGRTEATNSTHQLDRWILARLGALTAQMTGALEAYDLPSYCRPLRAFIDDYSTWYLRRSRDRVKGDDAEDKQHCLATQRYVLLTLTKLMAPVTPFIAESIYRGILGEGSVHLQAWPSFAKASEGAAGWLGWLARMFGLPAQAGGSADAALIADMEAVRALASRALEARERAGLKVRQPLGLLKVRALPKTPGLAEILADEVNVKKVEEDPGLPEEAWLDTELTEVLREEGKVREFVRAIQQWRKEQGLQIADRPDYTLSVSKEEKVIAEKYRAAIIIEAGLGSLEIQAL